MKPIIPLLAAAALLTAGSALADKGGTPPGHAKGGWDTHDKGYETSTSDLPPGMQKKLDRTGELPPGWQKKVQVGNVLDQDLYERSSRVSLDLAAKLPTRPEGTIDVRLEDRVVRMREGDRRITDIYQLKLR